MLGFYRTKTLLYSTDLLTDGTDIHFIVKQMKKIMDVVCCIFMYISIDSILGKKPLKKIIFYLIPVVLGGAATVLTSGGRSILMHMVVAFVLMFLFIYLAKHHNSKAKNNKKIFFSIGLVIAIGLILFYFLLPLLGRSTNQNFIDYISFYLGVPIPSLQLFLNKMPFEFKLGAETFSGINYVLYKLGFIDMLSIGSKEWVHVGGLGSNVYTSFREFFMDFGLFGVIFCQFIFGFLISLFYKAVRNKKSSLFLIIYSYYAYVLIDQIRDEQFFSLLSTATIAYLLLFIFFHYFYFHFDFHNFYSKTKELYSFIKNKILFYMDKIKQNSFWKNLFTNSFWALAGDSFSSIINLVITIVLIHLIGDKGYGTLVLAQSYMLVMDVILNVQCWKSVIQYGQNALVKKNKKDFYSYIKLGCTLDLSTALIGGVVSFFLAGFVGSIFNWSSELIWCSRVFSFTIFSHFSGTTTAILRLLNKFNLVAYQKVISAIIKLTALLSIFLFQDSLSLSSAVVIYAITDIIGNLLLVVFAFYSFSREYRIKELLLSENPTDSKSFIQFTLWGTLSDIVDVPINYFDVFILSFLGEELVAVFKVFKQFVSILSKLTTPIYQAIMPQFSSLSAQGKKEFAYSIVLKIRNAILMVIGPVSFIIGVTSPLWLKLLYGSLYSSHWYILLLYLLGQTFILSYTTVHPYFVSLGKVKESALYVFISNVIYMILALILVRYFGMIALVLCYFVQGFVVIFLKLRAIKKELVVV